MRPRISVVLRARNDLDQAARALGFGAAILITLVAVAMLLPGASQSTAATVIAFTSTVATSFLVRPQDHEIEGQLLRALGLRLALIGSMPVIGSVVLAVGLHRLWTLLILLALAWIVLRLTVTITPRRELVPLNSTSAGYVEQINDLRQVSWRIVDSAEGRRLLHRREAIRRDRRIRVHVGYPMTPRPANPSTDSSRTQPCTHSGRRLDLTRPSRWQQVSTNVNRVARRARRHEARSRTDERIDEHPLGRSDREDPSRRELPIRPPVWQ